MATTLLRPDQSFYPSPRLAAEAPVETLAYMVTFDPTRKEPDGLVTLDVDPKSKGFGKQIGRVEAPNDGDEFHHFGGNVCSSALCPYAAHPHLERRYLLVPGLSSSRISGVNEPCTVCTAGRPDAAAATRADQQLWR